MVGYRQRHFEKPGLNLAKHIHVDMPKKPKVRLAPAGYRFTDSRRHSCLCLLPPVGLVQLTGNRIADLPSS